MCQGILLAPNTPCKTDSLALEQSNLLTASLPISTGSQQTLVSKHGLLRRTMNICRTLTADYPESHLARR